MCLLIITPVCYYCVFPSETQSKWKGWETPERSDMKGNIMLIFFPILIRVRIKPPPGKSCRSQERSSSLRGGRLLLRTKLCTASPTSALQPQDYHPGSHPHFAETSTQFLTDLNNSRTRHPSWDIKYTKVEGKIIVGIQRVFNSLEYLQWYKHL